MANSLRNWWRRWIDNPVARVIVASLRIEPEDWSVGNMCTTTQPYTIDNEHGVSIWWANGWWFVAICCPAEEKLGLIGRTRVWLAARRWLRIHGDIYNKNAVAMAKLLGGDTCDEQGSGK